MTRRSTSCTRRSCSNTIRRTSPSATSARSSRILNVNGVAVFDMPSNLRGLDLSSGSHSASIGVIDAPRRLEPGESATVRAVVSNTSKLDWPAGARLAFANHWVAGHGGRMAVQDDGRSPIEDGLALGDRMTIDLEVEAPATAGRYVLELDLVEEGICWFADPRVIDRPCPGPGDPPPMVATLEVGGACGRCAGYRHRRAGTVLDAWPRAFTRRGRGGRNGGEVLDVVPFETGGVHWDTFRYFVVRR